MTKIEELKAAYEATPGLDWRYDPELSAVVYVGDNRVKVAADFGKILGGDTFGHLIALMHNNLPALLEAVEALEASKARASGEFDNTYLMKYGEMGTTSDDVVRITKSALEKLK